MDHQEALNIVYGALDLINSLRAPEDVIVSSPEVVLAGAGGIMDSLALTTLVLSVESRVGELTGVEISLIDGGDLDAELESLRTPATLAATIVRKLGHD
jgi:hypothetical protein